MTFEKCPFEVTLGYVLKGHDAFWDIYGPFGIPQVSKYRQYY